jgi:serine/threonine protein kinase
MDSPLSLATLHSNTLAPGLRLGRYEIRSKIGEGGMGEVYLAQDTELDRPAALKFLLCEVASDQRRLNRFFQEAKAASALNHPNILTVYEIGRADNKYFLATEFVDGPTLRQRMRTPLKPSEVLDVATQIVAALVAAHAAGIVHRDIKPENVIIRLDRLVKVLDFGIAKLTEQAKPLEADAVTASKGETSAGMIIGTASYMSPEQARGKPVDARSDIFSFGVVLYEMVSGRKPFAGENAVDVIGAVLHKEPEPLRQFVPDAPSAMEKILDRTLKKDREERYQTAQDLLIDLKSLQKRQEFETEFEPAPRSNTKAEAQTQILTAIGGGNGATSNSIAVLPFMNLSADKENEYFGDGLAEEIINTLTKLPELRVIARTSAFAFRGKE